MYTNFGFDSHGFDNRGFDSHGFDNRGFDNRDAGDGTGLEALFRSQQFGRGVGGTAGADGIGRPGCPDRRMFPPRIVQATPPSAPVLRANGDAGGDVAPGGGVSQPARAGAVGTSQPQHAAPTSRPAVAPSGEEAPASRTAAAPKRPHHGFRTAAMVSGLAAAALVVAGVTSGTGQHRSPVVSAQGKQTTGGSRGLSSRPSAAGGAAGTATTGGPPSTGMPGAGTRFVSTPTARPGGSASGPGGRVNLGGAATTTGGGSVPAPTSPSSGSGGSPPPPLAPPAGGGNPGTPAGSLVGNTVTSVVTSVTDAADQVGASVPGTAPTTGALGNALGGVGQAVTSASS